MSTLLGVFYAEVGLAIMALNYTEYKNVSTQSF